MEKSPEAFRTISEVAEWLDVPTHVLRFWESRFAQVKPVKRAGGRRYYRPSDMRLIGGIKKLLHEDGMTIRGVQKLLREEGVKYVSAYSRPLDSDVADDAATEVLSFRHATEPAPAPQIPDEEAMAEADSTPASEAEPEPSVEEPAVEDPVDAEPVAEAPALDFGRAPEPEPVSEPETIVQFDSIRRDDAPEDAGPEDAMPEPAEPEPVASAEPDTLPELPFIGSARDHPAPMFEAPEPEPEPPAPQIPATPDVPATDAPDDAAAYATGPGMAARLIAARGRGMIDVGALAEAASALRALRDRPPS